MTAPGQPSAPVDARAGQASSSHPPHSPLPPAVVAGPPPRLNLATRPFRNERLPATLTGLAAAVLAVLTVVHVLQVRRLLPGGPADLGQEVAALEREAAGLRRISASRAPQPAAATVAEWRTLAGLVEQRRFSWVALLGDLERALPRGVRLTSISPNVRRDHVALAVRALARPAQEGLALIEALEQSPEFSGVIPLSVSEEAGEGVIDYSLRYTPRPAPSPTASPSPAAPATAPEPAAEAAPPASPEVQP